MKLLIATALLLLPACAPRRLATVPPTSPQFPANTTSQYCWWAQHSKDWECDFTTEDQRSMNFQHKRVPR